MLNIVNSKKTFLYIVLSGIFLTNAIIAEIIGIKIISLENIFGVTPLNLHLTDGLVINFNLTAGVIVWPIVFITTDIINEYYGPTGVKKITYLGLIFISYIFIVIGVATKLPAADFWAKNNDSYISILSMGQNIIVGSLSAFLISQLMDAYIFQAIRKATGGSKIWLRATGSTLISQLADSFIVIYIAFYLMADEESKWTSSQIFSVAISNYIYKFSAAILLTPLLYISHYLIDNYLGKESEVLQTMAEKE